MVGLNIHTSVEQLNIIRLGIDTVSLLWGPSEKHFLSSNCSGVNLLVAHSPKNIGWAQQPEVTLRVKERNTRLGLTSSSLRQWQ